MRVSDEDAIAEALQFLERRPSTAVDNIDAAAEEVVENEVLFAIRAKAEARLKKARNALGRASDGETKPRERMTAFANRLAPPDGNAALCVLLAVHSGLVKAKLLDNREAA
jgi:hypothetical protein